MNHPTRLFLLLAALTVLLMSIPFLVPHCGWLALIGWVPLLCLEHIASQTGIRRLWPWHYGTFVLWNAATTFWVCNATLGGGLFAIFANALQMSLIFGLFRLSKKHFTAGSGGTLPRPRFPGPGSCWETLSPDLPAWCNGTSTPGPWEARSGCGP